MNARELAAHLADGGPVKVSGGNYTIHCPAHRDRTPSLSVTDGNKGTVLHCHAGCLPNDILAARGVTFTELMEGSEWLPEEAKETVYAYTDEQGQPLFEVVRKPGKQFRQRVPDRSTLSGYRWSLGNIRRVLFRLPEVIDAVADGHEVWVTEGEKDCEIVRSRHVCATTNPGGAGKWRDEYAASLAEAHVTVWADADEVGRQHARQVRESLLAVGAEVRIVESAHGKDAHDHLIHGLSLDDVLVTVPYQEPEPEELFLRADAYIDQDFTVGAWAMRTLIRQGEVLVLTGFEGMGKSSMMKQIAVCAACGLHPFALIKSGEPVKVLYIDCENSRADCIEDFTRLRIAATEQGAWDDPDLYVHDRPQMNVAGTADLSWLVERVHAHQPDLLVIGPIYGLIETDIAREEAVRALKRAIAATQAACPCAVVLEHHSPHRNAGEEREVRPIGSSLLLRWPSFGFGLRPTDQHDMAAPFDFEPWRGSRRRGRSWPDRVRQAGSGWFWEQCE